MRLEAWACDRCGRLVPTGLGPNPDEPPLDWLVVNVTRVGFLPDDERLFCSDQCASIGLRPDKAKPTRPAKKTKKAKGGGQHVCPECGATYDRPQSLGIHRRREHGVLGSRHAPA